MAEFNLHARLRAEVATEVLPILEPYAEDNESVTVAETDNIDPSPDDSIVTPTAYLEIEGIEQFAEIYTDLKTHEAVADLALWGPTAERFPIPVEHYALQQLGNPELYEFHALDGQTTLVVAESQQELSQVRSDIPPGALG